MFALARIFIFIEGMAVKISQSVGVLWKMGRYPVQNDADTVFMEIIYKIHEILWRAISGGRRKISGYLIAPGAVIGMFRNSHKLYMGISHFLHIGSQLMGGLDICIAAIFFRAVLFTPGAQMNFIDAHGLLFRVFLSPLGDPVCICPGKAGEVGCYRSGAGSVFCAESKGIGLIKDFSRIGSNGKFVEFTCFHAWVKVFPDSHIRDFFHGIGIRVPAIEVAYQMNLLCMRSPNGKINPCFSFEKSWDEPQFLVNIIMSAGSEEIAVQLRDHTCSGRR